MTALTGTCDCGAVTREVPGPPARLTQRDCAFCRAAGILWAYYPKDSITVTRATDTCQRGQKRLDFHRCAGCGLLTHWRAATVDWRNSGVNMRLFAPSALTDIPIGPPE